MSEQEKTDKEIIQENRKRLMNEGFLAFFIKPELQSWKEKPLQMVGIFLFWAGLFYMIFTSIQAVNFDMIYCDSNYDQFDGKVMDTYNEFVAFINEKNKNLTETNTVVNPYNWGLNNYNMTSIPQITQDRMECHYNLTRWWKEPVKSKAHSYTTNLRKMVIERWKRNKDTT